jgi:hypothetical protein
LVVIAERTTFLVSIPDIGLTGHDIVSSPSSTSPHIHKSAYGTQVVAKGAPSRRFISSIESIKLAIQASEAFMNKLTTSKKTPIAVLFALGVVLAIPVISIAQGRGNGKGQGGKPDKCAKFVNCHDARDGRVDGRGPAVNPGVIPINQPPILYPSRRNGGQNNQIYYPRRNRQIGRDDDDDNNQNGTRRRRRNGSDNTDPNNQNGTWRRRRSGANDTETRNRRVRRNDRTNVID